MSSPKEDDISPTDAAAATLQDCMRQLATWPTEKALIDNAQKLVGFLRDQHDTTFKRELDRIDVDLSVASIENE